nr:conjugal transfer protein TraD [Escherichia coli]
MSFNAKDMTQGGQIASMRIRMFSQMGSVPAEGEMTP